eukprot:2096283-Karenia_brevis.AAC.1
MMYYIWGGAFIKTLNALGLPTHEQLDAASHCEFVGLTFSDTVLSIRSERMWRIRRAREELLYHACYSFISRKFPGRTRLWKS